MLLYIFAGVFAGAVIGGLVALIWALVKAVKIRTEAYGIKRRQRILSENVVKTVAGLFYCEKCKLLGEDSVCSFCGTKKLRELKENDAVYLTTKDFMFSSMFENILVHNKIPCLKQAKFGAAMTMTLGTRFEEFKFFVPFSAFEKAKELLEEFFTEESINEINVI